MRRRDRCSRARSITFRGLAGNDRDAGCAKIDFRPSAGEWRNKESATGRQQEITLRLIQFQALQAVVGECSTPANRADCHDLRRAGGKLHHAAVAAGRSNHSYSSAFGQSETLFHNGRAARAAVADAGNVDLLVDAIVERRSKIAAISFEPKLADV